MASIANAQNVVLDRRIQQNFGNGAPDLQRNMPGVLLQTSPRLSSDGPDQTIWQSSPRYGQDAFKLYKPSPNVTETLDVISPEVRARLELFGAGASGFGWSLGPGSWNAMTPYRAVPPDDAVDEIAEQIKPLPEPDRLRIVNALGQATAISQRQKCTVAVKDLIKGRVEWGGRTLATDFPRVCIGDPQSWFAGTVSDRQRSMTDTCTTVYESYRRECLGQGSVETKPQEAFVGILVRRIGTTTQREIICTATLVGFDIAITAAHCLDDLRQRGPVQLGFFSRDRGIAERTVVAVALGPDYGLKPVTDLRGSQAVPLQKRDDIAFLFFENVPRAEPLPTSALLFPTIAAGTLYQPVALVGFQFLAKREFILKWLKANKLYLDDEALLKTGAWQEFVFKESTPHCMSIKPTTSNADPREIGHQCQSFNGTSGAPMFTIKEGRATLEIGAIHTLAAELTGSDTTQAINEGVLIPANLNEIKARLEGEFSERF